MLSGRPSALYQRFHSGFADGVAAFAKAPLGSGFAAVFHPYFAQKCARKRKSPSRIQRAAAGDCVGRVTTAPLLLKIINELIKYSASNSYYLL